MKNHFGEFDPKVLEVLKEAYNSDANSFAEGCDDTFDFKTCKRSNGTTYGVPDGSSCAQKGAKEVAAAEDKYMRKKDFKGDVPGLQDALNGAGWGRDYKDGGIGLHHAMMAGTYQDLAKRARNAGDLKSEELLARQGLTEIMLARQAFGKTRNNPNAVGEYLDTLKKEEKNHQKRIDYIDKKLGRDSSKPASSGSSKSGATASDLKALEDLKGMLGMARELGLTGDSQIRAQYRWPDGMYRTAAYMTGRRTTHHSLEAAKAHLRSRPNDTYVDPLFN